MGAFDRAAGRVLALRGALEAAAGAAVDEAAGSAAREARALAPVDSGALRAGIRAERIAPLEAAAVSATPHAAPVEFGTSRMAARPYMLPAAQAAREAFFASARAAARRAAGEVWK